MAKSKVTISRMKSFIRKMGEQYLKQKNVTSIGIGYKIKGGKTTSELSIQFTVSKKVKLEMLETLGAFELPGFIVIDGVDVPTDVIERNYKRSMRPVNLESKIQTAFSRKGAIDPIVPGVSIGHISVSAGTAGCVVYDAKTGIPYILSNWHVLCGPHGKSGDAIVQPGSYDDDRIEKNIAGKLVRSHLGVAGDCAIASIESRKLSPSIHELGVEVREIGEPELGDRVIKSGRTTGVTQGIVKRIHTIVSIDYDLGENKNIGCFEIGPDPEMPAKDGEISMGGDSGAAWLFYKKDGSSGTGATTMIAGLHFAGEVGDEPEHALACYPGSVFEKLEILPSKPSTSIITEANELGYASNFLSTAVSIPEPATEKVRKDMLSVNGKSKFDYMHFSLAMSVSRRFAFWVAWNIDGSSIRKLSRKNMKFKKDSRIPSSAQAGDELYSNNQLDRGHIARRADLLWGSYGDASKANEDSFYFTNITPQHQAFNQSAAKGIWGELENAIFEEVDVTDLKVSVIGGPIFTDRDPVYRKVQLPKQFFKIIYFREKGNASATVRGYVLTQADLLNRLEILELPDFAVYEVPLSIIGELSGLSFQAGVQAERDNEIEITKKREKRESAESFVRRIASIGQILG